MISTCYESSSYATFLGLFFKQRVSIAFHRALKFAIKKKKRGLTRNVCSRFIIIIIKSHNLHASNIRMNG